MKKISYKAQVGVKKLDTFFTKEDAEKQASETVFEEKKKKEEEE